MRIKVQKIGNTGLYHSLNKTAKQYVFMGKQQQRIRSISFICGGDSMGRKFLERYLILLAILILLALATWGLQELLEKPVHDAVLVLGGLDTVSF